MTWPAPGFTSRTSWPGTLEFNQARSSVYRELGVMPENGGDSRRSTGQHRHPGEVSLGAAARLDLLAVVGPPDSRPLVRQLRSPAQPEALTYGSAFSRGALIRHPDVSLIQVSGTAAIDAQGRSLHPGDVQAQVDCTFDKIGGPHRPGRRRSDRHSGGLRLRQAPGGCPDLPRPICSPGPGAPPRRRYGGRRLPGGIAL